MAKSTSKKLNRKFVKLNFDKRCLICIDLDGTLLNKDSYIRSYSRDVIKKLTKQGHIVCIFTGRPIRSSIAFYRQLKLKTPIVNYNGAMIHNPSDPTFAPLCFYINTEVLYKIFHDEKINELTDNVIFETPECTYFLKDLGQRVSMKQFRAELAKFNIYTNENVKFIYNDFSKLTNGAWSVLATLKNMNDAHNLKKRIEQMCSSVVVREWTEQHVGTVLEINSLFPSKGMALQHLSVYYDIPLERCYAFGDNENDVAMLKVAGVSYAMKNGCLLAKKAAKNITKYDNHMQGVARELNRIFKLHVPVKINKNLKFEDNKQLFQKMWKK